MFIEIISFKNSADKYILNVNEYHYVSTTTYTCILYKYTHLSQIELITYSIYLNKQINSNIINNFFTGNEISISIRFL